MASRTKPFSTVETAEVVVCLPTYRRPKLLEGALESLCSQVFQHPFEVVVVDNDAEAQEGASVANRFFGEDRLKGICGIEPRQGNCYAINTAFETALSAYPNARYILMLDDDELATPSWLEQMVSAARATSSGIVGGPVLPRLGEGVRKTLALHHAFAPAYTVSGAVPMVYGSGNCLITREAFALLGLPAFDIRYNFLGGGDTDFFTRARLAGINFYWAGEAVITEAVPSVRTSARWLLARGLRIGAINYKIDSTHAKGAAGYLWVLAKNLAVAGASVAKGIKFLVETHEPMMALHPAMVALGRCLAAIGIEPQPYRAKVKQ